VLGLSKYIDDLGREGMWYGATVRSTIPRGKIRAPQTDPTDDIRSTAEYRKYVAANLLDEFLAELTARGLAA